MSEYVPLDTLQSPGLPDTLKVAGVRYAVELVPFVEIQESRNYQGSLRERTSQLEVVDSLTPDKRDQVFVHEMMHAVLNQAGYGQHDEDMVERMAIVLHQVLQDNDLSFLRR